MSLYLGYALTRRENFATLGQAILWGGVLLHLASLVIRTVVARQIPQHGWYVPWSNWFESFSFFSLIIAFEYLFIQFREHLPILGAIVTPVIFIFLMVAVHSPFGMQIPTVPQALQSYWMSVHVP